MKKKKKNDIGQGYHLSSSYLDSNPDKYPEIRKFLQTLQGLPLSLDKTQKTTVLSLLDSYNELLDTIDSEEVEILEVIYNHRSFIYYRLKDYKKSLQNNEDCVSLCDDSTSKSYYYFNMGLVNYQMVLYRTSLDFFEKCFVELPVLSFKLMYKLWSRTTPPYFFVEGLKFFDEHCSLQGEYSKEYAKLQQLRQKNKDMMSQYMKKIGKCKVLLRRKKYKDVLKILSAIKLREMYTLNSEVKIEYYQLKYACNNALDNTQGKIDDLNNLLDLAENKKETIKKIAEVHFKRATTIIVRYIGKSTEVILKSRQSITELRTALEDFNHSLRLMRTDDKYRGNIASIFNNRSCVFKKLGEFENAISDCKQCVIICDILKQSNYNPYFNLGIIYAKISQFDEAEEYFKLSLLADQKKAAKDNVFSLLKFVWSNTMKYKKALEYLENNRSLFIQNAKEFNQYFDFLKNRRYKKKDLNEEKKKKEKEEMVKKKANEEEALRKKAEEKERREKLKLIKGDMKISDKDVESRINKYKKDIIGLHEIEVQELNDMSQMSIDSFLGSRKSFIDKENEIQEVLSKKIFKIDFEDLKIMGFMEHSGSGSSIFKCDWLGKVSTFSFFATGYHVSEKEINKFQEEVFKFMNLNHPSVLKIHGFCYKPKYIGMITEHCKYGDLKSFLVLNPKLSKEIKLEIIFGIALAMKFLHSQEIIVDLNIRKVYISDGITAKIVDYGITKIIDNVTVTKTVRLRFGKKAPETQQSGVFSKKSDIYSFGVICYKLFMKSVETREDEKFNIMKGMKKAPKWLKKMTKKCLEDSPSKRYDSFDIIADEILRYTNFPIPKPFVDKHEPVVIKIKQIKKSIRAGKPKEVLLRERTLNCLRKTIIREFNISRKEFKVTMIKCNKKDVQSSRDVENFFLEDLITFTVAKRKKKKKKVSRLDIIQDLFSQIKEVDSFLEKNVQDKSNKEYIKLKKLFKGVFLLENILNHLYKNGVKVNKKFIADVCEEIKVIDNLIQNLNMEIFDERTDKEGSDLMRSQQLFPSNKKNFVPKKGENIGLSEFDKFSISKLQSDTNALNCFGSLFNIDFKEIEVLEIFPYNIINKSPMYRGRYNNEIIALKRIKIKSLFRDGVALKDFQSEIQQIISTRHPFILRVFGTTFSPNDCSFGLILEVTIYGDLEKVLVKNSNFPNYDKLRIIYEIALALQYLHGTGTTLCNLHLNNILLTEELSAKLFNIAGITKFIDKVTNIKTVLGDRWAYDAPEIIHECVEYSQSSDVFSFAVVMFVLLSSEFKPFGEKRSCENDPNNRPNLNLIQLPSRLKSKISSLIAEMWDSDPLKRPTVKEFTKSFECLFGKLDNKKKKKVFFKKKRSDDLKQQVMNKINENADYFKMMEKQFRNEDEGFVTIKKEFFKKNIKNEKFRINYDHLELNNYIGSGGSCSVFHGTYDGKEVAFKSYFVEHVKQNEQNFMDFEKELAIFLLSNHPNILTLYGYVLQSKHIGLVMEYCKFGSLKGFLHSNLSLPQNDRIRICFQVALGIQYLHGKKIIHRDLKLDNVLINDELNAKVMDFGPELYVGIGKYNEKVDSFSFAILFFQTLVSRSGSIKLFESKFKPDVQQRKMLNDPHFRPNLKRIKTKKWVKDLIRKNWEHEPEFRDNFNDVVEKFIRNCKDLNKKSSFKVREESITVYFKLAGEEDMDADDFLLEKYTLIYLKKLVNEWRIDRNIEEDFKSLFYVLPSGKQCVIDLDSVVYGLEEDVVITVDF